jgi:gas vesicle protein
MTINDLRNIDRDDVLAWLGVQKRTSTGAYLAGCLGLFAGGLVLGAGAALLMAPKPGRELREDLRARMKKAANGAEPSRPTITRDEDQSRY